MTTVSERLSVDIDDPSLNGKDSFNGHHPRANTVEFLPREVNILSVLAGNALTKQQIICNAWEEVYKKDAHFQFPTTIHQLNERLASIDSPLRVKNTGGRRNATYELVDITPPPPNPIQPPLHDDSRQEAFEQASDYAEEQARNNIRPADPIHHDNSRDEAFTAVAEFDEEQRVARQNQRPPLSPRTQELRARMLAHNPIQPSDGTLIEVGMPLGPLVEESHHALKKISPSPSLQDSIQKFEAFKQEQRRQKVQERWDQRQQRIETRKRIQEWTHEQQAQIATTQIPEVAEEAERRRQAAAAEELRLEPVRAHFKTDWEDLPERTEDDQVLIDFNQRNEDYKKSQASEAARRTNIQARWNIRTQRIRDRHIREWVAAQSRIDTTLLPQWAASASLPYAEYEAIRKQTDAQASLNERDRIERGKAALAAPPIPFESHDYEADELAKHRSLPLSTQDKLPTEPSDSKLLSPLEQELLQLLVAQGGEGLHHFHVMKTARKHGIQQLKDLLQQLTGLKRNGLTISRITERGGGRFYVTGKLDSIPDLLNQPPTVEPTQPKTSAAAPAPVRPKAGSYEPRPDEIFGAPKRFEKPQEPKVELSAAERRIKEAGETLIGVPRMVFDAVLRLQEHNMPTTPEAIADAAFPSWTPDKAMARYQKGLSEIPGLIAHLGVSVTTSIDDAGVTHISFGQTSKKTS